MYNPFYETLKPYIKNRLILKMFKVFDVVLEKYADGVITELDEGNNVWGKVLGIWATRFFTRNPAEQLWEDPGER